MDATKEMEKNKGETGDVDFCTLLLLYAYCCCGVSRGNSSAWRRCSLTPGRFLAFGLRGILAISYLWDIFSAGQSVGVGREGMVSIG